MHWRDGRLHLVDQRALPGRLEHVVCSSWQQVREAICSLAVRGAPAIGLAGAYGVVLAAQRLAVPSSAWTEAVQALRTARPTAVDLSWAVQRVARDAEAATNPAEAALRTAMFLHRQDAERCARIAKFGAELIPAGSWVLTHCHTGALATGGEGTALGAIAAAHRAGRVLGVYADETRPLWQGARLTAWECGRRGIPCRLLVDGAAGGLLASGRVAAVLVGADRIAANGDIANKVGTYPVAVLAARSGVPFYVLAPESTIDSGLPSGADLPIEERPGGEVLSPVAAPGTEAYNPAFDVTPAELVTALVTEGGVLRWPYAFGISAGRGATERA